MRTPTVVALCAAAAVLGTGCESTRDKAAKITQEGNKAFEAKGLSVTSASTKVDVVSSTVITDANGTAAVVGLRNTTGKALEDVPVAITVTDAAGKALWKNDAPGLETGLVSAPLLEPKQTVLWVNDQVQATTGKPAKVVAKVGDAKPAKQAVLLDPGTPVLGGDPTDGVVATGKVKNTTAVEQKNVIVSCVARKGEKIVAAGRAIVPKVLPGKQAPYSIFFIGDPRGAELTVSAPAPEVQA